MGEHGRAWDAMERDSTNDHEPRDLTKPEGADQESILDGIGTSFPANLVFSGSWLRGRRGGEQWMGEREAESSSVTARLPVVSASQTLAANCHAE